MILRLTQHRTSQDVVVVHAGPELAEFMGRFAPARWQASSKAYWVEAQHLGGLFRLAEIEGHTIVDDRRKGAEPEKFTGPLPECSECGFAATRQRSLALQRCPGCGVVWRPRTHQPGTSGPVAARVDCVTCGRSERVGLGFCGGCGTPLPAPVCAPRPAELAAPVRREEPTLFEDAVAEVATVLEDDRDFAKRAAGDR